VSQSPDAGTPRTTRVVVGVDGSDESAAALRWAARQADLTGASLVAVISWQIPALAYGSFVSVAPEQFSFDGAAEEVLAKAVAPVIAEHPGLEVTTRVVQGPPALVLLHAAEDAELLVIGSRGHGAFTGMLLGSVSEHCVAHATCPVVVVRHDPGRPVAGAGAAIPLSSELPSAAPVA
jgi:nucleotide-binding universal stress UspA family protein